MIPEIITRENNYYVIETDQGRYYYSYITCIAYANFPNAPLPQIRIRRDRNFSTTTAKHMTKMGVNNWDQVSDEEFKKIAGGEND